MLRIQKVSVNYGKSRIVTNVSFDVKGTEKLMIIGRNGVGKTTLLYYFFSVMAFFISTDNRKTKS